MKEHFEKQLEDTIAITEEKLKELKGKSMYSDYEVGDKILAFMEQQFGDIEPPYTEPKVIMSVRMFVDRELDKIEEEFKYIRKHDLIPILERKE